MRVFSIWLALVNLMLVSCTHGLLSFDPLAKSLNNERDTPNANPTLVEKCLDMGFGEKCDNLRPSGSFLYVSPDLTPELFDELEFLCQDKTCNPNEYIKMGDMSCACVSEQEFTTDPYKRGIEFVPAHFTLWPSRTVENTETATHEVRGVDFVPAHFTFWPSLSTETTQATNTREARGIDLSPSFFARLNQFPEQSTSVEKSSFFEYTNTPTTSFPVPTSGLTITQRSSQEPATLSHKQVASRRDTSIGLDQSVSLANLNIPDTHMPIPASILLGKTEAGIEATPAETYTTTSGQGVPRREAEARSLPTTLRTVAVEEDCGLKQRTKVDQGT